MICKGFQFCKGLQTRRHDTLVDLLIIMLHHMRAHILKAIHAHPAEPALKLIIHKAIVQNLGSG